MQRSIHFKGCHFLLLWLVYLSPLTASYADNLLTKPAQYQHLARISKTQLDQITSTELQTFGQGMWPGYKFPQFKPAQYEVDVFRVSYETHIPEQNNKPITATGLLAIPVLTDYAQPLPLISYQHGTVFGKYEVPSYAFSNEHQQYAGAYENRLNLAQFAGQGYLLIAPDYFGMGGNASQPEGYTVKASHQQACWDLHQNALSILASKNIEISHFFIAGWSQGGLVTLQFLEKLENAGVKIKAASTVAAPADPYLAAARIIFNPRDGTNGHTADAIWLNSIFILSAFSYQNYYQTPDLTADLFQSAYVGAFEKIYQRTFAKIEFTQTDMIVDGIPTPIISKQLLNPKYTDPTQFSNSAYANYLRMQSAYQKTLKTKLKMYYGEQDEAFPVTVTKLPVDYLSITAPNLVEGIALANANHRGAFISAIEQQKAWFDSLLTANP